MRPLATMLVLAALASCHAASPGSMLSEKAVVRVPVALVWEKEISGKVLAYDLRRPSGLALSPAGDLYLADAGNHRIIMLDRELNPVRDYSAYGIGIGQFQYPEDLFMDRGLNLYVLDAGNRRIVQMDARLGYIDAFRAEDDPEEIISTLGRLAGLVVSSLGEVTVADNDNSRLIRMDNFKRFIRYIGDFAYGEGSLLNPQGLAQDGQGRLYVADAGNARIAVYDDFGNYLFSFGREYLTRPAALAIAGDGVIWVADRETDQILAFAFDGRLLFREGNTSQDQFRFADVEALAITPDGKLIVADSGRDRLTIYRIIYEEK